MFFFPSQQSEGGGDFDGPRGLMEGKEEEEKRKKKKRKEKKRMDQTLSLYFINGEGETIDKNGTESQSNKI